VSYGYATQARFLRRDPLPGERGHCDPVDDLLQEMLRSFSSQSFLLFKNQSVSEDMDR
jgi:hypothetical protein